MIAQAAPGFVGYLTQVWSYRHFWLSLVRIDLRNRYKRSVLGVGWSMLHPIAMTAVLCYCFHIIFEIKLNEYVPFLLTGVAFWGFISAAVTEGCHCFYIAQGFIKAERLPLAVYPLRVVLGNTLHFCIAIALAIVTAGFFHGYESIVPLISLFPTILLLALFGWSCSVLAAFACVHFPDVQQLATIGLQILFYLTPVMYPPEIANKPGLAEILRYNPLGYLLVLLREPIMESEFPSLASYGIAGGLTLCMVAMATLVLKRFERTLIFALV